MSHKVLRTFVDSDDLDNIGIFVDLDGAPLVAPEDHPRTGVPDIYLEKIGWSSAPQWKADGPGNHSGPVTFEVEAGTHTFTLRKRKGERPQVDKIVLEFDGVAPADLGPESTRCDP